MLRFVNFSRNVGGTLIRSTLREDRPKSGVTPTPQFLFWFNETPGLYTPIPTSQLASLSFQQPSNVSWPRASHNELAHFVDFTEHQEDNNQDFQATPTFNILRALHYGAILAVGYNIFHDKNLTRAIQESSRRLQNLELKVPDFLEPDFLQSHCPVLAVKHQKTALAQPLEHKRKEKSEPCKECCAKLSIEELFVSDKNACEEPSSTSDYSSHKSDSSSSSFLKFSNEEQSFLSLHDSIPQAVDAVVAIQLVKNGDIKGIHQLTQSASLGCSISQFYLGQAYEQGHMVNRDMKEAARYYKEAADGGHVEAKYNLGVFYLRGDGGCEFSEEKGIKLVQEAAKEGLGEAVAALDISEGKDKCEVKAVDMKEIEQLFNMGRVMEENQLNDVEDQIFALELYRVAALNGHKLAEKKYLNLSQHWSEQDSLEQSSCSIGQ
eukprot:GFUD01008453.1.p1 GENE.GFUD01008453.1~~GFUD01008453.1.p1  ORF type:complete len:435 (-),score=102.87 GFUD01008453.1:232-1536(-)